MFADGSLGVRCIWWLLQCSHLMVPLCLVACPPPPRDALEEKGPQRRLDRRLEEVAKAVGGSYCRLQMPAGSWRSWGQWLGVGWAPQRGGCLPPLPIHPCPLPPQLTSAS